MAFAVVAGVVGEGLGWFLNVGKLQEDAGKPCMISQERLHYNWKGLEL